MADMPPYAYTAEDLAYFIGHWTPAEIAATGASPECIASFLGYLERTMELSPQKADKAEVTEHIQDRLRDDPGYDQWRTSGIQGLFPFRDSAPHLSLCSSRPEI